MSPRVSVVMSAYNSGAYLALAIESILGQTWRDLELVVIDDGSTDDTPARLDDLRGRDARLRIEPQARGGLSAALNRGLELARGEYVARMDADDLSLPGRLAAQVALMDRHPEVGVCGAWVRTLGDPDGQVWRYPLTDAELRARLLFENPLAHPTVILRRASLDAAGARYDPAFSAAQDYDLWVRLADHCALANVGRVLLRYRRHPVQVGQLGFVAQQRACARVRERQIQGLGLRTDASELALHHWIALPWIPGPPGSRERAEVWLLRLRSANVVTRRYPEPAFSRELAYRWYTVCAAPANGGATAWRAFWRSPLTAAWPPHWRARKLLRLVGRAMRARGALGR